MAPVQITQQRNAAVKASPPSSRTLDLSLFDMSVPLRYVHASVKVGHYALQFGGGHAVTCAANKKQVLVSRCLWIYTIKSEWQAWLLSRMSSRRRSTHVYEFPLVAVRVLETVLIHKAVVLWLGILRAASGNSLGDELLDFSSTLAT
jgi:hypothetical protein